ncbi:MAG: Asp/Glu/hydantoin racemase [Chloroflexi bacterium]|jgi:allantoin racemase|nr:MAG: Asp/Glu/hydantoin racemase [Chloroflexota bacterium]|tara:strand:- start:1691 stop:2488 length:798 start_codon:yes stop_codon:yes gene_type:complete
MKRKIINIWYQGYLEISSIPEYQKLLQEHVKTIEDDHTTITINGMPPNFFKDTSPAEVTRYASSSMVFSNQLLKNALRAEEEKFDGFAIGMIQNLALNEINSLLDMPVVGYGQASMEYAQKVEKKFAVLAFNPNLLDLINHQIKINNFSDNAIPSIAIDIDYNNVIKAFQDPEQLINAFNKASEKAILQGAEIIIPGQMVFAEILWKNKIFKYKKATVVDAMKTTIESLQSKINEQKIIDNNNNDFWTTTPPIKLKDIIKKKLKL